MSEGHGILDRPVTGKVAEIGSQESGHVARRRIDLAGAWPLESSPFHTGSADGPSPWAVTLHGAAEQIGRQRQRGRCHPQWTGKPLMHQRCKSRVIETAFKGDPQQHHGRIGIKILLPRFMVRTRFPGIEEANKIWPGISPFVPRLVFLRPVRQAGTMAGKLPQCYPANITTAL